MKSLPKKAGKKPESKPADMPLGAINYVMIACGAAVIALSYLGMYLERDVDGFFSLYISPFTLVAAYTWTVFAVLLRRKKEAS
jgi:hypothetical protein